MKNKYYIKQFYTLHLIENLIFSCRIFYVQLPLAVCHADLEAGLYGLPDQHVSWPVSASPQTCPRTQFGRWQQCGQWLLPSLGGQLFLRRTRRLLDRKPSRVESEMRMWGQQAIAVFLLPVQLDRQLLFISCRGCQQVSTILYLLE